MLAKHDADGFLPEGLHVTTWTEFVERFGGTARRTALLARLRPALLHLAQAGCPAVLVGGSFVTTKARPMDVDLVWSVEGVAIEKLHPMFLGPDGLPAIKALFGADLFPSILMEADSQEAFAEFFQHTRDGRRVGVVVVDLLTLDEETDE
jgi:hypothetical protein